MPAECGAYKINTIFVSEPGLRIKVSNPYFISIEMKEASLHLSVQFITQVHAHGDCVFLWLLTTVSPVSQMTSARPFSF